MHKIKKCAIFGDLHLGINCFGFDRTREQVYILDFIADFVIKNYIDTVIITGDVYHTNRPHASSEMIMMSFLDKMIKNKIQTYILCGNHDYHNSCYSAIVPLQYQSIDYIHVIDTLNNPDNTGVYINGDWTFIPYSKYNQAEIVNNVKTKYAASHLTVEGALHGAESFMISNVVKSVSSFPKTLTHMFSGHIHKEQEVRHGDTTIYYHGSIIRGDFGERNDNKTMIVFDTENEIVNKIPLPAKEMILIHDDMKNINLDSVNHRDAIVKLVVDNWDQSITKEQYEKELYDRGCYRVYSVILNKYKKNTPVLNVDSDSTAMSINDTISNWYKETGNEKLYNNAMNYFNGAVDENN